MDLVGFASAGALPFLAVSVLTLCISTSAPTQPPPKGRDRQSWFVSNKWTSRILLKPKRSLPYRGQMGNIRAATMPKWGNVLAHVGQRACPKWARCLPRMGRFAVRGLPNKLIQRVIRQFNVIFYNCLQPYAFPFISQPSRQLPDNRQAVNYLFVRILR